jgi:hypothetical protein
MSPLLALSGHANDAEGTHGGGDAGCNEEATTVGRAAPASDTAADEADEQVTTGLQRSL